jgi:hypothetical protein
MPKTVLPWAWGRSTKLSSLIVTDKEQRTLPRTEDFALSRFCWGVIPVPCPWSETIIIEHYSNASGFSGDLPDGYDRRLPRNITEIYSAGISNLPGTVSSAFDIQWRTYRKIIDAPYMFKGQPYIVGDYRHLSQMVLNDAWEAVTGLVVNTKTGGIGFRNHTTPPPLPYGSTWSEDLLFVEPDTECVDMNITMDFNIPRSDNATEKVENVVVTDHGGFANLDLTIPWCRSKLTVREGRADHIASRHKQNLREPIPEGPRILGGLVLQRLYNVLYEYHESEERAISSALRISPFEGRRKIPG